MVIFICAWTGKPSSANFHQIRLFFEIDMPTATKPRPKSPTPPKPEPRKELPVNAEYEEKAKALLRFAMSQRGVGPEELAERLSKMGIDISGGGVANKISRGGFSSMFLLQCMDALEINLATLPR
jgi:hypothetical protein